MVETELARQAPSLAALCILTGPVLILVYRLFRLQAAQAASLEQHLDKWMDRHELAEQAQFATIEKLSSSIDKLADTLSPTGTTMNAMNASRNDNEEPWYGIPEPPELQKPVWEAEAQFLRAMQSDARDWGHTPLGLAELHADPDCQGKGTTIAILDTGIDFAHPDLAPNRADSGHRDFTGSRHGFRDVQGHGTHCAGIAASSANGLGMIGGAPKAKLVSVKILGDDGRGLSTWTDAGLRHAGEIKAGIISGSLGGPRWGEDTPTRRVVKEVLDLPHHPWIVFALGNDGPRENTVGDPGWYPEIVGVAASNRLNRITNFSSRDPNPAHVVAAPGEAIVSTLPNFRYGAMSGTSMATPIVAGAFGSIRSKLESLGLPIPHMRVIIQGIRETSADIPPNGPDTASGSGLLQPKKLLEWLIAKLAPKPDPKPEPKPEPQPGKPPLTIRTPELEARGIASLMITFTQ